MGLSNQEPSSDVAASNIKMGISFKEIYKYTKTNLDKTRDVVINCLRDIYGNKSITTQFGVLFPYADDKTSKIALMHFYKYSDNNVALVKLNLDSLQGNDGIVSDVSKFDKESEDYKVGANLKAIPVVENGLCIDSLSADKMPRDIYTLYEGGVGRVTRLVSNFVTRPETSILTSDQCSVSGTYNYEVAFKDGNYGCFEVNKSSNKYFASGLHLFANIFGVPLDEALINLKSQGVIDALKNILEPGDKGISLTSLKQFYIPALQACFLSGSVPTVVFKDKDKSEPVDINTLLDKLNKSVTKLGNYSVEAVKEGVAEIYPAELSINLKGPTLVAWDSFEAKLREYLDLVLMQILFLLYCYVVVYEAYSEDVEFNKKFEPVVMYNALWEKQIHNSLLALLCNTIYVTNYDSRSQGTLRYRMMTFTYPVGSGCMDLSAYPLTVSAIESGKHVDLANLLSANDSDSSKDCLFRPCAKVFGDASGAQVVSSQGYSYDGENGSNLSATYAYIFDQKAFESSTLFGYTALDMLKVAHSTPSMKNCYIGQAVSGSFSSLNFENYNSISIAAGSRSGKGTVTNCIIASIISAGGSIIYLDGKPDVSGSIMQVGRKLGTPVLTIDGLKIPYKKENQEYPFDVIDEVNGSNFEPYNTTSTYLEENFDVGVPCKIKGENRCLLTSKDGFDDEYERLILDIPELWKLPPTVKENHPVVLAAIPQIKLLTLLYKIDSVTSTSTWYKDWINNMHYVGVEESQLAKLSSVLLEDGDPSKLASTDIYVFFDEINNITGIINSFLIFLRKAYMFKLKDADADIATRSDKVNELIEKYNTKETKSNADKLAEIKSKAQAAYNEYQKKSTVVTNVFGMLQKGISSEERNIKSVGGGVNLKFVYVGQCISGSKFEFKSHESYSSIVKDNQGKNASAATEFNNWAYKVKPETTSQGKGLVSYDALYPWSSRHAALKLRGREYCDDSEFESNCKADGFDTSIFTSADKALLTNMGVFKSFIENEPSELLKSFAVFNKNDVFDGLLEEVDKEKESDLKIDKNLVGTCKDDYTGKFVTYIKGDVESVISYIQSGKGKDKSLHTWLGKQYKAHSVTGRSMATIINGKLKDTLKDGWASVFRGLVRTQYIDINGIKQPVTVANSSVAFDGFLDKFLKTNFSEGRDKTEDEYTETLSKLKASFGFGAEFIRAFLQDIGLIQIPGMEDKCPTPYKTVEEWLYDCSTSSFFPWGIGEPFEHDLSGKDEKPSTPRFSENSVEGLRENVIKFFEKAKSNNLKNKEGEVDAATGFGDVALYNEDESVNDEEEFENTDESELSDGSDIDESDDEAEDVFGDESGDESGAPENVNKNTDAEFEDEFGAKSDAKSEVEPNDVYKAEVGFAIKTVNNLIPCIKDINATVSRLNECVQNKDIGKSDLVYVAERQYSIYTTLCDNIILSMETINSFDKNYGLECLISDKFPKTILDEFIENVKNFKTLFKRG